MSTIPTFPSPFKTETLNINNDEISFYIVIDKPGQYRYFNFKADKPIVGASLVYVCTFHVFLNILKYLYVYVHMYSCIFKYTKILVCICAHVFMYF